MKFTAAVYAINDVPKADWHSFLHKIETPRLDNKNQNYR